jgi:aspartate/methionine/tyrosine aminotransferase
MYFPMGIPAQASEAKAATINATIGQLTDGKGAALPLPAIAQHIRGLDLEQTTLYAPQGGNKALRAAWGDRLRSAGTAPMTLPFCTVGLTHGLSLLSDLFVDADTDVLLPHPGWGNYNLVFGVRGGGRIHHYPVLEQGVFAQNALKSAIEKIDRKGVLVLNFPGNPTGYTPTTEELKPWLDAIRSSTKPITVICDDAYAGYVYEEGLHTRSLFFDLADAPTETVLTAKVDGATKELCFFGGRVGFVTFGAEGLAADALELKIKGMARASVSSGCSTSQAMVLSALNDPDLQSQQDAVLDTSRDRYLCLKNALNAAGLPSSPFNSGFFAMIPVNGDVEALRKRLLVKGVGVVALPQHQAIRIAFSSTAHEDIPALVDAIADEIKRST